MRRDRIEILDALRGLSVILMVIHHLLYDLMDFLGLPEWLYVNPVFTVLQLVFASVFIMLAGISSRFSQNNVKRGLKLAVVALVISAVTILLDMPIYFGIIHFMSVAVLFYSLTCRLWRKIPTVPAVILFFVLFAASKILVENVYFETNWVYVLGLGGTLSGYDYYTILPWIFMFLLGAALGSPIKEGKFPAWFYKFKSRPLSFVGRHSLLIYLVHQPLFFGVINLYLMISGKGV